MKFHLEEVNSLDLMMIPLHIYKGEHAITKTIIIGTTGITLVP